jgi:hypothetical protein
MDIIRTGTFRQGFEVGYRAIKGTSAGLPGTPGTPGVPGNSTAFLEGVKAGLKAAGLSPK